MDLIPLDEQLDVYCLNEGEARFLYEEIFEADSYLQHGIGLADGAVVFDVGANIGLFGVHLARRFPNVHVHAFEPVPEVHRVLEANLQRHHVRATTYCCALGAQAGTVDFTYYPNNSVMSGRYANQVEDSAVTRTFIENKDPRLATRANKGAQRVIEMMVNRLFVGRAMTCPVRTLSEILASERIERVDLLKVDVEKSEHEVLAGLEAGDWERIRQVVVEVHDIDGRREQLRAQLERAGFQLHVEQEAMLKSTNVFMIYAHR